MSNLYTSFRPNSFTEFNQAKETGIPVWHECIECARPFDESNVHTVLGWRETQITGYCEDCYDAIFADDAGSEDEPADGAPGGLCSGSEEAF